MSRHTAPAKRGLVALAALTVPALMLAGCTAAEDGGADGVTTVTVMYQSNEFTPEMIEAFEADNPDITIDFIEFDQTRLNASLTAGDPPDLVRGSPNPNLFAKGLATSLDDYVADSEVISEDDLLPVNDLWRWDGSTSGEGDLYGVIKDWSADTSLWQNTALFESAGVEPLSTTEVSDWDTVLDKAEELKAAGVEYPLGLEWQWGTTTLFTTMIAQQGGEIYNDDLTAVDFDTPEAERAMQWLVDYGTSGVGVTSLNPLPDGQDGPAFQSGRMAMTMTGYWMGGMLVGDDGAAVRDTAQLVPTPTFGERIASVAGGVGGWIPSASDSKDQAWRVLEYFMGGEPAVERSESGWGLPALESLWGNLPSEYPFQVEAAETAKLEADAVTTLPTSPYMDGAVFVSALDRESVAAIKGEKTVKQALADLEAELNDTLAQGKDQLG
ncbi:hypothetical protein GCM10009819_06560 [Agromyces tropicus]|uniref:Extracellular solute-binding protein n=1 Tax=Agromyces tropicus TaxID=555371 RepID=A0ABN2U1Z7_9MICO